MLRQSFYAEARVTCWQGEETKVWILALPGVPRTISQECFRAAVFILLLLHLRFCSLAGMLAGNNVITPRSALEAHLQQNATLKKERVPE